jgi:hypothetical protein
MKYLRLVLGTLVWLCVSPLVLIIVFALWLIEARFNIRELWEGIVDSIMFLLSNLTDTSEL